jgi:hypothetical protein
VCVWAVWLSGAGVGCAAYLKMDNVLIDDRRIHVDFSQSVSRLQADWRRTYSSVALLPARSLQAPALTRRR